MLFLYKSNNVAFLILIIKCSNISIIIFMDGSINKYNSITKFNKFNIVQKILIYTIQTILI